MGRGAINSLIEGGVIGGPISPINTPLITLVYLLPLLPLIRRETSDRPVGSEVGQYLGQCLYFWGSTQTVALSWRSPLAR